MENNATRLLIVLLPMIKQIGQQFKNLIRYKNEHILSNYKYRLIQQLNETYTTKEEDKIL